MLKTLEKIGVVGTFLNIVKAIYAKPHGQYHSRWWKTESIPPKNWNKEGMPSFTTSIQYHPWDSSQSNRQTKEIKGIWIGKEELKLYLFAEDMIIYLEEPENSTRNS